MNLSNPTGSSRWFAHELIFAWLTLTAGAMLFTLLATLLAVKGFSETVSFLVPLLVTLVLVVALHLNRLAEQWPNTGRGSALRKRVLSFFIKTIEPRSEEEIVELFVKYYWISPPERRSFESILEEVARELGTRNNQETVKAELEKARQTIQRMLEALG